MITNNDYPLAVKNVGMDLCFRVEFNCGTYVYVYKGPTGTIGILGVYGCHDEDQRETAKKAAVETVQSLAARVDMKKFGL